MIIIAIHSTSFKHKISRVKIQGWRHSSSSAITSCLKRISTDRILEGKRVFILGREVDHQNLGGIIRIYNDVGDIFSLFLCAVDHLVHETNAG